MRSKKQEIILPDSLDKTGGHSLEHPPFVVIIATEAGRQARRWALLAPAYAEFLLPIACKGIFDAPGE